jgi:hypothetical protein
MITLTIKIWNIKINTLYLYSKLNTMTENFYFGMMVTQMVLCGIFCLGIVYLIGFSIVESFKKN